MQTCVVKFGASRATSIYIHVVNLLSNSVTNQALGPLLHRTRHVDNHGGMSSSCYTGLQPSAEGGLSIDTSNDIDWEGNFPQSLRMNREQAGSDHIHAAYFPISVPCFP